MRRQPITVTVYSKPECSLCDAVQATLNRVLPDYAATLQTVNIENDPELHQRYKEKIPVIAINGEDCFIYKVRETALREKLNTLARRVAGE